VKFTVAGEVVVVVGAEAAAGGRVRLRFEVSDTGIGIASTSQERIFSSFSQADNSTTRRYGGTGLGLTISQRLIDLMGGEIGVRSTLGSGSVFWFTVALEVGQVEDAGQADLGLEGVAVVIVEDNATSRMVLERDLTAWGMICETAADPAGALELMRAAARAGAPHRLALIDYGLPQVSGVELAMVIKADPALSAAQLILLTSSGMPRAAAVQAGISGFVTKPIRRPRLRATMTRVLRPGRESPTVAHQWPEDVRMAKEGSRGRVLVAEDNQVNQLVAIRMLEKRGFRVEVAANGREALAMHAQGRYEAIFMDCQMPELDGYRATAEIRRREGAHRHTPIIAMTANAIKGDRERCVRAGMDDYVGKPVRADALDEVLAREVSRPPTPPDPGSSGEEAGGEGPPVVFDPRLLADICDGDDQVRRQLVAMFLDQAREATATVAGALAAGDDGMAQRTAHALKGSSAVLGAQRLSVVAGRLEAAAAAGRHSEALVHGEELELVYGLTASAINPILALN
jgi:CheY-like chemotaxis protein